MTDHERATPRPTDVEAPLALLADLEAFALLLEAEWYNGNLDEPAYLRLNRDLGGIISKHRQPSFALSEPSS